MDARFCGAWCTVLERVIACKVLLSPHSKVLDDPLVSDQLRFTQVSRGIEVLVIHRDNHLGIHPIKLIKEPEAAALHTLRMLQDKALAVPIMPDWSNLY